MTKTSEERREVAERLRDCIVYAKKHDLNGDCDMGSDKCVETRNTLYNDIASCIEEYGNFNLSAEQVFTRLADLIDPTCHMTDSGWDNGECTWGCICSACGARIEHEYASDIYYCPNCGARVVSGDAQ
jgi:hypothetical protein